jgi:1-acyl-sn-glycerol-3-phosphate acyltransferase
MLYSLFRWLSRIALSWFYRDIRVVGAERIPAAAPLLVAANHPNALIDALVVGTVVPRHITLTAKATLFENPLLRFLFARVGMVPLRRAKDEAARAGGTPASATRNLEAFRALLEVLERRGAILIFPEGISHDAPSLAPLKTGIARIALQARDERGVRGLHILPVGITFERKGEPRSRVVVEVGEPIGLDGWAPPSPNGSPADALTEEVEARLRAVTLNFPSREHAERVLGVSETITTLAGDVRPLSEADAPLTDLLAVARRVEAARQKLDAAAAAGRADVRRTREIDTQVDALVLRIERFRAEVEERRLAPSDLTVDLGARPAAWFVVRESLIMAVAGPLALWGRINHFLPFRLARLIARRSSRTPEDPAMHTIVLGLALVLLFYALQTALVWALAGPWWALAYLVSLPPSATWALRFADRWRAARARVRTYLTLRRDPELRRRLCDEIAWLRGEAAALNEQLAG